MSQYKLGNFNENRGGSTWSRLNSQKTVYTEMWLFMSKKIVPISEFLIKIVIDDFSSLCVSLVHCGFLQISTKYCWRMIHYYLPLCW